MSMILSNSVSPAFAHARNSPFAGGLGGPESRSSAASTAGYAFETALCVIESQSPLLRPTPDRSISDPPAGIAERHTQALSSRILQLTRLLDHIDETLDADETRVLLDTAARVTSELIAVFGPSADGRAIDSTVSRVDRSMAADTLARARQLAQRIRSATQVLPPVRVAA